ncbi:MAG: transcriptional regulator [Candidatus Omnitrophica bacterium CG11_big_fil_rev_8_21_14_0_20_42_13]|uniref:Transcriptional regulator n=1 Tax=Candidatus Ghiorseimicrobium undicola TaxID=1974746 RepID=A0A2H0LWE4_9BACT|nr:MAG: transcriptional regulator [Candidatus Omnitrophica bacterium CG11_big_fil_rev_8_21_14_0_20_42_13]
MFRNLIAPFEDYSQENDFFITKIIRNIEKVLELKSEHEHEKYIESFEKAFAEYNGSKYAIAVNSGTAALELALKASGIKENDEVILPSYTYISSALAVSNIGAIPKFVDIKHATLTIDPYKIQENINNKTKALMPVHIHGNPCEIDKIMEIARKNSLAVIEDCSHAHGAEYGNKKVGNFGIGCFSCHSSKIFSGMGNSGLITINNAKIYDTIKKMTYVKNNPELILSKRTPCKIDVMQTAILGAKLPYLEKIISRRRKIAYEYMKNMPTDIFYQKEEKKSRHVYRDFIILSKNREKIKARLHENSIQAKIRYNFPLHLTEYYRYLGYKDGDLPVVEKVLKKALWLPISYAMPERKIAYICDLITKYMHEYNSK